MIGYHRSRFRLPFHPLVRIRIHPVDGFLLWMSAEPWPRDEGNGCTVCGDGRAKRICNECLDELD